MGRAKEDCPEQNSAERCSLVFDWEQEVLVAVIKNLSVKDVWVTAVQKCI
uniref:Uncharacterized protein n=1 Tax=Arion vulgaris TaxID=1028688 RepID=A0A0B7A5U5_9EUPU